MKLNLCPIEFHDLFEIIDFLLALPPKYLYQYDGQYIRINPHRYIHFRIMYIDGAHCLTYRVHTA